MSIFNRIFKRGTPATDLETRAASDYLPAHAGVFGGAGYNDSGVSISETNALISSTVWACVSLVSQTIATLPVHVIDEDGGKQRTHRVAKLLATAPNPFMTASVFREALLSQAMLWGGAYAAIEKDETGRPIGLYPLASDRTRPIRQNGEVVYQTLVGSTTHYLTADQVVVLLGWTSDGITPLSPVQHARQSIGLSVAAERYAGKAFGTAGNLGGILQMPAMNADAMKAFVESWRANYSGLDGAFKIAALPDPMRFTPTTMKPGEAQLTEVRQALVVELARIWRVPPSMLGVLEKSSYASLEAQNTAFYQQTVLPWLVKLEQEFDAKLLLEAEKDTLEVRFNADALLRASTQERYSAYNVGRQGGFLSVNDIRRRESLPPIAGGDVYLSPLNMTPADGQQPATPTPAKPDEAAARSLIEDAARRVLVKESRALIRAAKRHSGPELRQWANKFYAEHAKLVARVLAAPMKAAGLTIDPAEYAREHCDASIRSIESATDAHDVADDFTDIRPADIANDLWEKRYAIAA